ncbi:class I SAM-dependent RNA methyltransferase [Jiella sp. MQZ9-1]|uniref:Class I SAM-dependent RNA methyltransferase n=1 Tax=Jiella flava TaxID=2816857 RepID=A0A939FWN3_9HYPH|nr:class I SAM-dependent RNA methyltransferase [Jiella flava]MBO0661540.1 class I SAM-dependent RNA methyltransferase [Jiella flava]MCD2470182.1 class I SAM-dependent RNA methyltransferase [Jiella flava]
MRVTIDSLGAKGDGVAITHAGPAYLPFTLPGEVVELEGTEARPDFTLIAASPERQSPACRHFTECGGCDLQHASETTYHAFKRGLVVAALQRQGIEVEVAPLVPCAPASRRRVTLTAVRTGNRVLLGYNAARSTRVVPIETCPIAMPQITAALPVLRRLAGLLIDRKRPLKLLVTMTAAGLDIAAEGAARLSDTLRQQAVALTLEAGVARLSLGDEILVMARAPFIDFAGVPVALPPGAFLQAVENAERAMAERVTTHLAGAKRVADFFSGCGTFSLRLARQAAVNAVESDALALAVQDQAHRQAQGLKPLTTERRDLFRRPVPAKEMASFDAAVFDPPRAGAEGLARELAASRIGRLAAVSCNPMTLARDLKILVDGGYRIRSVTPIDQFLWSHHVEVVALLERG